MIDSCHDSTKTNLFNGKVVQEATCLDLVNFDDHIFIATSRSDCYNILFECKRQECNDAQ